MITEAFLGIWLCFNKYIFSRKLKKGPILGILWHSLPFNFCKLSPHKFSETLLLKKIYMICKIRDHSTFFIPLTIFEMSDFFYFFWVFKPNFPLTDTSQQKSDAKPSLRVFLYISKICLFFSGALLEGPQTIGRVLKLEFLRGRDQNEWPPSPGKWISALYTIQRQHSLVRPSTMFSLLGQHQISMSSSCLTKTSWVIMTIFIYFGLFLTVQINFAQCHIKKF